MPERDGTRFAPLVLAAVCVLVFFTGLGGLGLIDVREARDAEVARELVDGAEVLTPIFAHEPFFEKPILAYAPEVAARLLSPSFDLRSRWIRAAAAVMLILLTASIGGQHFGARAGWFSALVLATTLGMPLAARTDGAQVFASLLGWLGAATLADALFGRSAGRELRLVVGYGALAAALVVTGPAPALWPFGAVAFYLRLVGDRQAWRRLQPLAGLVLMLGVAMPWYGAMIERHGTGFVARVPFFPYALEHRQAWYAGPVFTLSFLVLGFFPWCALLPNAILHAAARWLAPRAAVPRGPVLSGSAPPASTPEARSAGDVSPDLPPPNVEVAARAPRLGVAPQGPLARERHEGSAAHFFVACLVASLVPIVVYPGPPLPSVLPALPAAALLCGRFLDHLFEDSTRVSALLTRSVLMLALLGTALAVLAAAAAPRMAGSAPDVRRVGTLLFATSWLPLLAQLVKRPRLAASLMVLPVALGAPLVALQLLPGLEGFLGTRPVAEALNMASPERAPLVLLEPAPPSLRLYARRNFVVADSLAVALERFRASDGLSYVAFRPRREREVAHAASGPIEILLRTPSMVLARIHQE